MQGRIQKTRIFEDMLGQVLSGVVTTFIVMALLKLMSRMEKMWEPRYVRFSGKGRFRLFDGGLGIKTLPKDNEIVCISVVIGGKPYLSTTSTSYVITRGFAFDFERLSRLDKFRLRIRSFLSRTADWLDGERIQYPPK